jgi:hypothetical protein
MDGRQRSTPSGDILTADGMSTASGREFVPIGKRRS